MPEVFIVAVFFLLSLVGAYVLFKILESSAVVKRPGYQAGGALAGFLLIFGTLAVTHQNLALGETDDQWTIEGTVVRRGVPEDRHFGISVSVIPRQTASSNHDGSFTLDNIKPARAEQARKLQFSSEGYFPYDLTVDMDNAVFDSKKKVIKLQDPVELRPDSDPNEDVVNLE